MNNLLKYFEERFPLKFVIPLALMNSFFIYGFIGANFMQPYFLFLITINFFFFMLKHRAIDEIRDFNHDSKNYPERPLQRGLITIGKIKLLRFISVLVEITSAYLLSPEKYYFYLLVLIYSFFTANDFFSKKFLKKHFTFDFIIHLPNYFLLNTYYWISIFHDIKIQPLFLYYSIFIISNQIIIEILRKFKPRFNKNNKPIMDTYYSVWGKNKSILLIIILLLLMSITLFLTNQTSLILLLFGIITTILLLKNKPQKLINLTFIELFIFSIIIII